MYKDEYSVSYNSTIWSCSNLERAILASALPFESDKIYEVDGRKQARNLVSALTGLHTLAGVTLPRSALTFANDHDYRDEDTQNDDVHHVDVTEDIIHAVTLLIRETESLAAQISLREAVELRWAIRGLVVRFGMPLVSALQSELASDDVAVMGTLEAVLRQCIPKLEERVLKLPFDIIPLGLDWNRFREEHDEGSDYGLQSNHDAVPSLLNDIPFRFDEITTRTGSSVQERRGTAWVTSDEIGALAYSGKLMLPTPIPPIVARAMRQVEYALFIEDEQYNERSSFYFDSDYERMKLFWEERGQYFDCALCNHYPNNDSACKFHTDPEHGSFWERLTCVISAGKDDVRKFAFRPIPDKTCWSDWEHTIPAKDEEDILPAVIQVS